MEKGTSVCKVCITGGSGNIGSWLAKKLLNRGYTVHATLRNLDDVSKVSLLKSLPGADERLVLFKADIYKPDEFEDAIQGCKFVFHIATPLQHTEGFKYQNTAEAAIATAKSIAMYCERSGSAKRLIYTSTVVSASPIKDDGIGFKDLMDENCWTPLDLSVPYMNNFIKDYLISKTLTEKELLSLEKQNGGQLEVVTLACGLVGGDTLLPFTPASTAVLVSQLTNNAPHYKSLKFLEELLGKVPVLHLEDACEALIFCMENSSIRGRVLCASSYISSAEISTYYQQHYPRFHVKKEYLEGPTREIKFDSSKLIEKGFAYKYDTKMILDDCHSCATRMGDL